MSGGIEIKPIGREHENFVLDTFRRCLLSEKDGWARVPRATDGLARALRDPGANTAVAFPVGHPDDFLGWAVGYQGALVFAYVRFVARRRGIGKALVGVVVGDSDGPIPLCYWTRVASRMAAGGRRLRYDLDAQDLVEGLAR